MVNDYTDPKDFFVSDGKYKDLRTDFSCYESERTALERLIKYKQDNGIYDIDNNFTSRKKDIFKPIADIYKLLWNVDVVRN